MSSDDIEALLSDLNYTVEKPIDAAPRKPASHLISNSDINSLITGTHDDDAAVPMAPQANAPAEPVSNDDIDALMAELNAGERDTPPEITAPAPKSDAPKSTTDLLSNDDIEALTARIRSGEITSSTIPVSDMPEEEPPEPAEPEENVAPPVPTGKMTKDLLSNDDLEALLASIGKPGAAPVETPPPPEEPRPVPGTQELLSNDDLDSLIASMSGSAEAAQADGASPAPERTQGGKELLSNDDLDALVASIDGGGETAKPDAPSPGSEPQGTTELLSSDDIGALLAQINGDATPSVPQEVVPAEEETQAPLSNDDLDALLAGQSDGSGPEPAQAESDAPSEVATNNAEADALVELAEAAPSEPEVVASAAAEPAIESASEPVAQDLIDTLLRDAKRRQEGSGEASLKEEKKEEERSEAPTPARREPEDDIPDYSIEEPAGKPHSISARLVASLAAGFFCGACIYFYLMTHPYRSVDSDALKALRVADPAQAISVAEGLVEGGRYSDARRELAPVLATVPPGPERSDAEYLDTEAAYRLLSDNAKVPVLKDLERTVQRLLTESPDNPKAGEAIQWKADLLKRSGLSEAAYEVYAQILSKPENPPGFDRMLIAAAATAMDAERPADAIAHLRRLLQAYPSSELYGDAEFMLGNAYLASGDIEAGRMTLMGVARAHPDSALGAEAFARLGSLSFEAGNFEEAIHLFETRLQTATKVEGNDKIYLLLAKAHRAMSNPTEAERVLRELIEFFPESPQVPVALVELSQVLDSLGRRDEAVNVAKQAAQQYADNPEVLANAGRFLAGTGDAAAGAETLVAAEQAGADNPVVLLEAARQYRAAKELDKASDIYKRIIADYPTDNEAYRAGIELARIEYERGRIRAAIERLEENVSESKGRPVHLEALDALGSTYAEMGLRVRAAEAFREIAAESSDPVMLARASMALFDAGEDKEALALAERVDSAALPEQLAYGLLMRQGMAVAGAEPERGLALMEQAYTSYPDDRRPEDVQRLLEANLALDRTAAVRAIVMDADARAKVNPAEVPTLETAAARWGDFLYGRADYRAAGDAYALAANAATAAAEAKKAQEAAAAAAAPAQGEEPEAGETETPEGAPETEVPRSENSLWSLFQQANCLYQIEDLQGSLPLYEEVAKTASPWSEAASAKAEFVKLELRRRGTQATTPLPAPSQPTREG